MLHRVPSTVGVRSFVWAVGKSDAGWTGAPSEDAHFMDEEKDLFAVADGVTRLVADRESYPNPSPARLAADQLILALQGSRNGVRPDGVLRHANELVGRLNRSLGLRDFGAVGAVEPAGMVAAVGRVEDDRLYWAYIGDAGIAVLDCDGRVLRETEDDVALARRHFPRTRGTASSRRRRVHRLRNDPSHRHGGYGVLTGEPHADEYIKTGSWSLKLGDVAVAFSDGFRPLLRSDRVARHVAAGAHGSISAPALMKRELTTLRERDPQRYGDEATVVAIAASSS